MEKLVLLRHGEREWNKAGKRILIAAQLKK
jgi:bisphosphoglycerate-dependent phosphoglycerate mutase